MSVGLIAARWLQHGLYGSVICQTRMPEWLDPPRS